MIITLLVIGIIAVLVIAIIGKMFVVMLSLGLLLVAAAVLARLSGNLSTKQALMPGGAGLVIALASFLLLLF